MQERKNFRKIPEKRCFYREKTFKKNRFCKGLVLPGKTCYDNNRKPAHSGRVHTENRMRIFWKNRKMLCVSSLISAEKWHLSTWFVPVHIKFAIVSCKKKQNML